MPLDVTARAADLRAQIDRANVEYYVYDNPTLTDAEYDTLMRELREIEAQYPALVTPDSPTQRVGAAPASQFGTVRHPIPLLSLGNVFSRDDLDAWAERVYRTLGRQDVAFDAEPKIDGLAVALRYEDGQFVRRGDAGRWRHGRRRDGESAHGALHPPPPARSRFRVRLKCGARST